MKRVFFGPFIGEFGWELLFWHGWVRKMCLEKYKNYYKIAASFPGRQPFYPLVDEFLSHPTELLKGNISSRAYYTDNWRRGFYKGDDKLVVGEELVNSLISYYRGLVGEDTQFIVPTRWNIFPDLGLEFGIKCPPEATSDNEIKTKRILFKDQVFDYLFPSKKGVRECSKIVDSSTPIIAIFPRARRTRRSDKNWAKEKYESLITLLQNAYPNYAVGIFGEPGGAYFVEGVPVACLDFININPMLRMDIQVAALKQTVLALGSMSGAVLVALACGTPSVTWGYPESERRYHYENFMNTYFYYIPDIDPVVECVFSTVKYIIDGVTNLEIVKYLTLHSLLRLKYNAFKYYPLRIKNLLKRKKNKYIYG